MIDQKIEKWFQILSSGEVEQIQNILMSGTDLLEAKQPPLMHTSIFVVLKLKNEKKCLDILKIMIKLGANVNAVNIFGQTPLFYAISNQKIKSCKLLLSNGASLNIKDQFKQTPLQYAVKLGNHKIINQMKSSLKSRQSQSSQLEGTVPPKQKNGKLKFKVKQLHRNGQIKEISLQLYQKIVEQHCSNGSSIQNTKKKLDLKQILPLGDTWQTIGLKIINRLQRMSESTWFKQRVITQINPEISLNFQRTDLSTIKLKLKNHIYSDPRQLRKQINNIWQNCNNQLGHEHQLTRFALQISSQFERLARDFGFNAFIK